MNDRTERAAEPQAGQQLKEELSDPIAQNIADVLELEAKELKSTTGAQRWLEAASRRVARAAYLVGLLLFVTGWIALNLEAPHLAMPRFDPPPFQWLQTLLTFVALLTTTVVLIGQARQNKLAEQRAHLDLQINLLTEQKVTKLIHLLEDLRMDTPGAQDRHDPHLAALKRPTEAAQVASALKRRDADSGEVAGEESSEE